jgi:hypothetical protein
MGQAGRSITGLEQDFRISLAAPLQTLDDFPRLLKGPGLADPGGFKEFGRGYGGRVGGHLIYPALNI